MLFKKGIAALLIASMSLPAALAQVCPAPWDFGYLDNLSGGRSGYYQPSQPPRNNPVDFSKRTLAKINAGQSNEANYAGDLYIPVHTAVIDQINIQNGGQYAIDGPMLGASLNPGAPGAIPARVDDLLISNNKFDRIFDINVSVTNTTIADWDTVLYTKICAGIQRLAAIGITSISPNVTFAMQIGIGESDNLQGTSQAAQIASYASFIGKIHACGFPTTGRIFLRTESYAYGNVSSAVTNAQAYTIANVPGVYQGSITDTIGQPDRCGDNTHLSDFAVCPVAGWPNSRGATKAALLDYNAMVASGAPF